MSKSFVANLLNKLVDRMPVVFPIHPRTRKNFARFGFSDHLPEGSVILTDPLDYFSFQKLISRAHAIVTDSGGIQEESTFRRIPCITLRPNTERPITLDLGTNQLVPTFDAEAVLHALDHPKPGTIPPLWDGFATERIIEVLQRL